MEIKLKNCPLCGSKVEFLTPEDILDQVYGGNGWDPDDVRMICTNEECMFGDSDALVGTVWESREAAAEVWNRRPLEENPLLAQQDDKTGG